MPPNAAVSTARRVSVAAPVAATSGTRPRMNAKLVIITGRKRRRVPIVAASSSERLKAKPTRIFRFKEIREAHRVMDANEASGKMVVVLQD
jgi:Zinc-binding dehydrogenase